jgi:urease subunit gamma/beta
MRLTPWEEERLLIFGAAELARRHLAAGLQLNAPEAIALICDTMLEAARAGRSYAEVEAAGHAAVGRDDVMPGVPELVDEVRLEVLLEDGVRLIVLVDPLASARSEGATDAGAMRPGALLAGSTPTAGLDSAPPRERLELEVRSSSRRVVRVSSHFPFDRVNPRLLFDRAAARGFRLDIEAGSSERWAPGETRTVSLVRFGGGGAQQDAPE